MFLDTSIVIELFRFSDRSKKFKTIMSHIADEILIVSVIQLAEITNWCIINRMSVTEKIDDVRKIATIMPLSEDISIEGAKIKREMRRLRVPKFGIIDGIILASARSIKEEILTTDKDFRKAKDAIIVS